MRRLFLVLFLCTTVSVAACASAGSEAPVDGAVVADAPDRPDPDAAAGDLDRARPDGADRMDQRVVPMPDLPADLPSDLPHDASLPDAPGFDASDARTPDAAVDAAPTPWPPPGDTYLTRIESESQLKEMFIIRRLTNDQAYPYPWNDQECIFFDGWHLSFLTGIDPERANQLYWLESKRETGTLIPGRITRDTTGKKILHVEIENFRLSNPSMGTFPVDDATMQGIYERLKRCLPFATRLQIKIRYYCSTSDFCSWSPLVP